MGTGFKSGIPFLGEKTPKTPTVSGETIYQDSSMIDIDPTNGSTGILDLNGLNNASFAIIRNIKNSSEIANSITPNSLTNFTGNQVINQNSAAIKFNSLSHNQVFPLVFTQPQSRMIFFNPIWRTILGTWTMGTSAAQEIRIRYYSDNLLNNEICYYLVLENMQYQFKLLTVLGGSDYGITTVRIDNQIVTTFDQYGSPTNDVYQTFNFTPSYCGEHKISLKSESKNVASIGYRQAFTWLCITPTTWRDRF